MVRMYQFCPRSPVPDTLPFAFTVIVFVTEANDSWVRRSASLGTVTRAAGPTGTYGPPPTRDVGVS